jgi:hypothetical protein
MSLVFFKAFKVPIFVQLINVRVYRRENENTHKQTNTITTQTFTTATQAIK